MTASRSSSTIFGHAIPVVCPSLTKTMISKDLSKQLGADLIICGATDLNAVERFLIGSVSKISFDSQNATFLLIVHLNL